MSIKSIKNLCIIALSCLNISIVQAQCPDDDVIFKTQEEIIQFGIDFPNCTELDHNFTLASDWYFDDLEVFSNLERINGRFKIFGNLTQVPNDLNAFRNLEFVEEFTIDYTNVESIDNAVNFQIGSRVILENCSELMNLGNIKLSENMIEFVAKDLENLGSQEFDILKDVKSLETLELEEVILESIDENFDITVSEDFICKDATELDSFPGLTFETSMRSLIVQKCDSLQGSILNFDNIEFIDQFYFEGNDSIKILPSISSLNSVNTLRLVGLTEHTNMLVLEDVVINKEMSLHSMNIASLEGVNFRDDLEDNPELGINLSYLPYLEDCDELSDLDYVSNIFIHECPRFKSIDGLGKLKRVTFGLDLRNLPSLKDLSPLSNLRQLRQIYISNTSIENFKGLESLEKIDHSLEIVNNQNLKNLTGLQGLKSIGSLIPTSDYKKLHISNNDSLNSIYHLTNAFFQIDLLNIILNPELQECSIASICQALTNSGTTSSISTNATGCYGEGQVFMNCRNNQALVYYDLNENNIRDSDEIGLPLGRIVVNDGYEVLPSNNNGNFNFYDNGENSTIEYIPDPYWKITGPDNVFSLSPDFVNKIEIGIIPIVDLTDLEVSLAFDEIICDRKYILSAIVKNTGTTTKSVDLAVKGNGTYASNSPIVNGDGFIEFTLNDMIPGEVRVLNMTFKAVGITEDTVGELIELTAKIKYEGTNDELVEKEKNYQTTLLCAYDPNDKQVFPPGEQDENLTLFEDNTLEYKIRFQNTGNFPAKDIVILDTLSEQLDINTLQFIHASHPVTEIIVNTNIVEFRFDNIFLPDSISNEPESHGFIQFSIETIDDLEEFSKVENTGHIIFDSNPAIVTNTVFNTYVSEIPMIATTSEIDNRGFKLMPNPCNEYISIKFDSFNEYENRDWQLYNQLGQRIFNGTIGSEVIRLDLSELRAGLYFFEADGITQRFVKQ